MSKYLKLVLAISLGLLVVSVYSKKINLVNADIGRHIKNGQITLNENKIPQTNYYSYTEPNFKVVNHHWLIGVIYFLIYDFGGFKLISIFNTFLIVMVFLIPILFASNKTKIHSVALTSLIILPLITSRTEVRPETISYAFISLYLFLFHNTSNKDVVMPLASFTLLIQLIWVNTHIFFIFGLFIIGLKFVISGLLRHSVTKSLGKLFLLTTLISIVNPQGLYGLLEPLMIFKEFGYMLVENQSLPFLLKRFSNPIYLYYILLGVLLLQIFIFEYKNKQFKQNLYINTITICFFIAGFQMVRLFPLFGIALIYKLSPVISKIKQDQIIKSATYALIFIGILLGLARPDFGFGLRDNVLAAAEFYKQNDLQGPIFNNYDNGGYLIFTLYPTEKVFVDNRPEAYSVEFFQDVYIPMQESEDLWQQKSKEYNINTIFFWRHDLTPWGQPFLIKRIQDPMWIPVYVDQYNIILVKNNENNKQVINQYKLPDEIFVVQ